MRSIRLLRSGERDHEDDRSRPPSLPSPRGEAPRGRDDASPDWSIVSGGGDGTVVHWSVMGLASEQERRLEGGGEGGIDLRKIGAYEVIFGLHLAPGGKGGYSFAACLSQHDH